MQVFILTLVHKHVKILMDEWLLEITRLHKHVEILGVILQPKIKTTKKQKKNKNKQKKQQKKQKKESDFYS